MTRFCLYLLCCVSLTLTVLGFLQMWWACCCSAELASWVCTLASLLPSYRRQKALELLVCNCLRPILLISTCHVLIWIWNLESSFLPVSCFLSIPVLWIYQGTPGAWLGIRRYVACHFTDQVSGVLSRNAAPSVYSHIDCKYWLLYGLSQGHPCAWWVYSESFCWVLCLQNTDHACHRRLFGM